MCHLTFVLKWRVVTFEYLSDERRSCEGPSRAFSVVYHWGKPWLLEVLAIGEESFYFLMVTCYVTCHFLAHLTVAGWGALRSCVSPRSGQFPLISFKLFLRWSHFEDPCFELQRSPRVLHLLFIQSLYSINLLCFSLV